MLLGLMGWLPKKVILWDKTNHVKVFLWEIIRTLQAVDNVVPFLKKSLDLVASKLSLEVVPFWETQANSGGHSATMFLGVFLFFLAFSLGLGI